MTKGQIHLSPSGPSPCGAGPGNCPFEEGGHYETRTEAELAFAESMGGSVAAAVSKLSEPAIEQLELQLDFGTASVANGDLSDPKTRSYFANGLCGDLANAIHSIDPQRKIYFSLDTDRDGHPNSEELRAMRSIDELSEFVFHAVIESKTQPGMFLDAYGLKSGSEIENFFGGPLVEAPSQVPKGFHSGASHDLSLFAESALALEREGVSYSYGDFGEEF